MEKQSQNQPKRKKHNSITFVGCSGYNILIIYKFFTK
jgi:hypothetical protein